MSLLVASVRLYVFFIVFSGHAMEDKENSDAFRTPPSTPRKSLGLSHAQFSPKTKAMLDRHTASPRTQNLLVQRASPKKKRLKPLKEQNPKVFNIKLEDSSTRWVKIEKKSEIFRRIKNAEYLKRIIKDDNLQHIDVSIPALYADESTKFYGIEKDCGKTLAQDASHVTLAHVKELLSLVKASGYRDMFPRNFAIKDEKLVVIDTDEKAFDISTSIIGAAKEFIKQIQLLANPSLQPSGKTGRRRMNHNYALLSQGRKVFDEQAKEMNLSDDQIAMIDELNQFLSHEPHFEEPRAGRYSDKDEKYLIS